MGLTVGKQTFHTLVSNAKVHHPQMVSAVIEMAYKHRTRIVLMVDDYTNIHTFRRPTSSSTVEVAHMATVLMRVFDKPAIPARGEGIGPGNDPAGINIDSQVNEFEQKITDILKPFAITALAHIQVHYFTPENERNRLTAHMYGEGNNLRQSRGVENSHLIDCIELPLKSVHNFHQAANVYLNSPLALYLQEYVVVTPGDWPAQFYHRQIAYNEAFQPDCLRIIIPSMGPLHISLNSQEHVVRKHIIFFQKMHRALFGKELANKPRPWRVTLLLELAYGGWTLIRQPILQRLEKFKDVQFLTLIEVY